MFTLSFWKDAFERAVKTFAQSVVGAGVVLPGDFFSGDVLQVAAVASVISVLTSIISSGVGSDKESASLVK